MGWERVKLVGPWRPLQPHFIVELYSGSKAWRASVSLELCWFLCRLWCFPRVPALCTACTELSGFLYCARSFCSSEVFLFLKSSIWINPRANGSVKHWINSLLMLTHKNRGTLACASPAQECFLQCGRDLGALIGSICLTCLNAFLEVNVCGLSLKFSNWFSSCAISCFIWACFVSLRKILLPSNSMLWSIPSSFLERRFCFVLFYRNSVTSVKCLTGLAALETGMLELQERVCLHQHQPIHVPAGPWPSYCQAAALGESAVVVGFQRGCSKAIQLLPGTFCWIAALWWWLSPTWDLEYQVYRMVWDITRT